MTYKLTLDAYGTNDEGQHFITLIGSKSDVIHAGMMFFAQPVTIEAHVQTYLCDDCGERHLAHQIGEFEDRSVCDPCLGAIVRQTGATIMQREDAA